MSIVHLLHGFVGAGKTTFAKQLQTKIDAIQFSPGALFIDQNAIDLFWAKFEPLQDDEEAVVIQPVEA